MCEACREIYGEKIPSEEPPCDTCRPVFLEENQDAIKIFFLVRGQLIVGAEGYLIDIMHEPIHSAMRLHEIKNKKDCFEKVLKMSQIWLESVRTK